MFESLEAYPEDPVLGLIKLFAADPHPYKLDLGVGVYMDETGRPPIMAAVKAAERRRLEQETSKAYIGVAGDAGFNAAMERLVFGADHPVIADGRVATLQTSGGCAALFASAMLIRHCRPEATVWISDPTWINHVPLFSGAGLALAAYPYYDRDARAISFGPMMAALETACEGDVVLLHGCCHNPSGDDLSEDQWHDVAALLARKRLVPLIDLAYQGLGEGLERDGFAVRLLARTQAELFVAASCSKNFGLYRDRIGSVHVIAADRGRATAAFSQIAHGTRSTYSMPPAHGATIIRTILDDPMLEQQWRAELEAMRLRILAMRALLARGLAEAGIENTDYLMRQRGMFSFLPLSIDQIRTLRAEHGIYVLDNGRINLSGLNPANAPHLIRSLAALLLDDAVAA